MPNYLKLYTPQDSGVEYAYTMVHKAPQSAKVPQVVKKERAAAVA